MNPVGTRFIVMLGTDFTSPGGITAVVRGYVQAGLFEAWPIRYLPTYRKASTSDKLCTAAIALFKFLHWLIKGEVAAIHAHTAANGSFWRKSVFLMLGSLFGKRTILHLHDGKFPRFFDERCGPVTRTLVRAVFARVDRVIALTPSWAAQIARIQPAARITVIPNGVSLPEAVADLHSQQVLFLGRLWQEKGILDLIDAAAIVVRRVSEVSFVCGGDGDVDSLLPRLSQLGIEDRFRFVGWVEGQAKVDLLASSSVFVLPSYFEGLPIGVLEAMAWGIPVVATRVGGIPEAVGDAAGMLVESGDVEGLANALVSLLSDSALRKRVGRAGRERVEAEFTPAIVLGRIAGVYETLGLTPSSLHRPK